jgi:hypothetical protein
MPGRIQPVQKGSDGGVLQRPATRDAKHGAPDAPDRVRLGPGMIGLERSGDMEAEHRASVLLVPRCGLGFIFPDDGQRGAWFSG